jgi:uncharacterized protein YeaO (DUF488 family)
MGVIRVKRIYDPPETSDGLRILVDRLWPRGLSKERAAVDWWLKEIAPSDELRKWFGHQPERWPEFKARYHRELDAKPEIVRDLEERARTHPLTLLFSAKDVQRNQAVALLEYLERRRRRRPRRPGALKS